LTSGLHDIQAAAPVPAAAGTVETAVVLATTRSRAGGAAALLPFEDGTLLSRLTGQLTGLGVPSIVVLTRPAWAEDVRRAVAPFGPAVDVRASDSTAADLRVLAAATGPLVAMYGDLLTHTEALRGLIVNPRDSTNILTGGRRRLLAFRVQTRRGMLVSAASPYHAVRRPNATFLGVLRIARADLPTLAAAADRLAVLVESPPGSWEDELERKARRWRHARTAIRGEEEPEDDHAAPETGLDDLGPDPLEDPANEVVLPAEDEAYVQTRIAAARDDAAALALLGLVRGGAQVNLVFLRRLYWSRPLSATAAALGEEQINARDEDRLLLDSAVKAGDGFFTTFFVSPYSKHIARWAAQRALTPNQVTIASLLIGILAAAAFATGERWGLVAGAVLLQVAFTTDCVDGQLARYTRTFSRFGAWLDSIFDRAKEYLAFGGLAIGASRAGDPVWLLACLAITLQTLRHMTDFGYGGTQAQSIGRTPQPPLEQPLDHAGVAAQARRAAAATGSPAPRAARSLASRVLRGWQELDRAPAMRWIKRMISFPIGERFALISITAALFTPRVTFTAVLSWGAVGVLYTQTGRVLRAIR
jgi:hypothetical protein